MFPKIVFEASQFQFDTAGYTKALRLAIARAIRMSARAFLLEADSRIPLRTGFLRGAFGILEDLVGSVVGGNVIPATNPSIKKAKFGSQVRNLTNALANVKPRGQRRKDIESRLPKGQKRVQAGKILASQEVEIAKNKEALKRSKSAFKKVAHAKDVIRHAYRGDLVHSEYYYLNPVGRFGLKKGVRRGITVLKTPTSGRTFVTLPGQVFTSTTDPAGWKFTYAVDIRYYAVNDRLWDSWRQALRVFSETFQQEMSELPDILQYIRVVKAQVPGSTTILEGGELIEQVVIDSIDASDIINNRG